MLESRGQQPHPRLLDGLKVLVGDLLMGPDRDGPLGRLHPQELATRHVIGQFLMNLLGRSALSRDAIPPDVRQATAQGASCLPDLIRQHLLDRAVDRVVEAAGENRSST